MTLKRTDAIDLEIIDKKYQTSRMLTLAQKEFRHKKIIEGVSILHSAIEKQLLVAWYTIVYLKFDTSPFKEMKGNYRAYLGYKELCIVLHQTGMINKTSFLKFMKFNSLRNEVIHEMMKLETIRKKNLRLDEIKKEFQNGVDCYKESKKIKDKYMSAIKRKIKQGQKKIQDSLDKMETTKKMGFELS